MAISAGITTSEFKLTSIAALLTTFGDQLNIFDVTSFSDDPKMMLIYRSVQVIAIAGMAIAYIRGRSDVKSSNGVT